MVWVSLNMDETGQEWSHSVQVGPELIWGGPFRSIHGRNRSGVVAGTNLWNREGGDMPPLFETIRGQATNIWGTVNKIPKWGQSQNSEIIEGAAFPWPTLNLLYEWSISVLVMSEIVWTGRDRYQSGVFGGHLSRGGALSTKGGAKIGKRRREKFLSTFL